MTALSGSAAAAVFAFLMLVPGGVLAAGLFADKDVIWKDGETSVFRYADQRSSNFGENDHPADLNADQIRSALHALVFAQEDGSGEEQHWLFTGNQMNLLSQHLAHGLATAAPDQDIVFALEKRFKRSLGLKPGRLFVAGRAFFSNGKLNIIIGDYDRAANDAFDAAYDPSGVGIAPYHFNYGRRSKRSRGIKHPIMVVDGIENQQVNGNRRDDWIAIDLALAAATYEAREKIIKANEQARQRDKLNELLGNESEKPMPAPAVMAEPPHLPPTPPAPRPSRSFESRLTTLNQLREQGLISEEEYAAKRQQILDQL